MTWPRVLEGTSSRVRLLLTGVFLLSSVLSAFLLFSVQPLYGKLLLPLFGGSPAVWNTCMVFFQATLLAGYAYAHALASRCRLDVQLTIHLAVLLLALCLLPIGLPGGWHPSSSPIPALQLLRVLAVTAALPCIVVSASAPLLQHWFAQTTHPAARSPYFFYAASNAGSFAALLSYPFLIEPKWRLATQCLAWSIGITLLTVAFAWCAWFVLHHRRRGVMTVRPSARSDANAPTWSARARWLALSAAPSSLLLGITTYLTTDVASIPLLWVGPLALYLLSFVLVFANRPPLKHQWIITAWPMFAALTFMAIVANYRLHPFGTAVVHLVTLFAGCMLCHGELSRTRPAPAHLTQFYLVMALGGVLGGAFNALLAPLLFAWPLEYPLALMMISLLHPRWSTLPSHRVARVLDFAFPLLLAGIVAIFDALLQQLPRPGEALILLIRWGIPFLFCLSFRRRPLRFVLGLSVCLLAGSIVSTANIVYLDRSFFGVYRVTKAGSPDDPMHLLFHGTTLHGCQRLGPASRHEPLSYYSRSSPIGETFADLDGRLRNAHIGLVGLGTGTLAAYAQRGQRWTFFEIDPTVARIARDRRFFTHLTDAPATVRIMFGDARQSLPRIPDQTFALLVLDAFSSDAIPMHLLTREALQLYQRKLAPGGIVAFHISNRHLNLKHVVGNIADATGWVATGRLHLTTSEEQEEGRSSSAWVLVAQHAQDLEPITAGGGWSPVTAAPAQGVWTDDYSNILSIIRWRR